MRGQLDSLLQNGTTSVRSLQMV